MKTALIAVLLTLFCSLISAEKNTSFYIPPLFEPLFGTDLSEPQARCEIERMQAQISSSRKYFRTGFAGILRNNTVMERKFRLAYKNNLSIRVIIGQSQPHAPDSARRNLLKEDTRRYQWRLDGKLWYSMPLTNVDTEEPTGDTHSDGMTDAQEKLTGTDPRSPGDLWLRSSSGPGIFNVAGSAGCYYTLFKSGSLTDPFWQWVAITGPYPLHRMFCWQTSTGQKKRSTK